MKIQEQKNYILHKEGKGLWKGRIKNKNTLLDYVLTIRWWWGRNGEERVNEWINEVFTYRSKT